MKQILVLDTGSPVVSAAIGTPGEVMAEVHLDMRRSSERLLGEIDALLVGVGSTVDRLDGLLALRGPGSFTGLRIGLATALGLAQSSGCPAGTLGTLDVLAAAAGRPCRAVVYAQRGEWLMARYQMENGRPVASGSSELVLAETMVASSDVVIGHDLDRLGALRTSKHISAPPLAGVALRNLSSLDKEWELESLTRPVYFRAPAATPART